MVRSYSGENIYVTIDKLNCFRRQSVKSAKRQSVVEVELLCAVCKLKKMFNKGTVTFFVKLRFLGRVEVLNLTILLHLIKIHPKLSVLTERKQHFKQICSHNAPGTFARLSSLYMKVLRGRIMMKVIKNNCLLAVTGEHFSVVFRLVATHIPCKLFLNTHRF